MRIYVLSTTAGDRWIAIAPQVPGAITADLPSRDEALAQCRDSAGIERAAFERLGLALDAGPDEELVAWPGPIWQIPEWLAPVRPAQRDAAVARIDELEAEVARDIDGLSAVDWERRHGDGWSARTVVDHLASGCGVFTRRLETWPLDPDAAQRDALIGLYVSLASHVGERFVVEQFGNNWEGQRVRWTPRKVARAVTRLQAAWLAFARGDGAEPTPRDGIVRTAEVDAEGDDEPLGRHDTASLVEHDDELRRAATTHRAIRSIALSYRYYRDRLVAWPSDTRERWDAMRAAFRAAFLALDDTGLALVRIAPNGICATVGFTLSNAIWHLRDHREQIRAATRDAAATA